ncbi:MAG: stage II sporulation protein M [Candidatus Methanofastidiosa archaeon]|nr:stage II sporulation protein M [Candidatus Methanofastidiosa archaeon]
MNAIFLVFLGAFILVAYKLGMLAWRRLVKAEESYFKILFCGASTVLLTFALVFVMFIDGGDVLFDNLVGINLLQAMVSIGLLVILHFEVTWARIWSLLKKNKRYIIYPTFIFMIGIILGLALENSVYELVTQQIEDLENISGLSSDRPIWQIAVFIFGNNTKTAILIGIVLPLIPLIGGAYIIFSMLLNGAIVGVFGAILDEPFLYFLVGILPHGIFEVPGIIIAAAVGLRLNSMILFGIVAAFRDKGEDASKVLAYYIREGMGSWDLMYLVLLLLLLAALIESTITPILLGIF